MLSVTNPNYSDGGEALTDGAFSGFEDHLETNVCPDADSNNVKLPHAEETISGISLNPRNDERVFGNRFLGVYDRMIMDAVPVKDVLGGPTPASV